MSWCTAHLAHSCPHCGTTAPQKTLEGYEAPDPALSLDEPVFDHLSPPDAPDVAELDANDLQEWNEDATTDPTQTFPEVARAIETAAAEAAKTATAAALAAMVDVLLAHRLNKRIALAITDEIRLRLEGAPSPAPIAHPKPSAV